MPLAFPVKLILTLHPSTINTPPLLMKIPIKSLLALAALAAVTLTSASAQVIFDDQFTSGTRQDAGYYISNTTNGTSASVGSGALTWAKTAGGTDQSALWKNFTSYNLGAAADGTFLRLNLAVTFTTIPVQNNGFRVGLYNFNGVLTSDATGANPPELNTSSGYNFQVGQDSTSTQSRITSFVGRQHRDGSCPRLR